MATIQQTLHKKTSFSLLFGVSDPQFCSFCLLSAELQHHVHLLTYNIEFFCIVVIQMYIFQIFIKFHVWQDVIFSACVWPAKPLVFHSLQGHCNYNNNNNPVVPYTMTVTLWYLLMVIVRWLVLLSPLSEHCSCPRLSAVSWTDNLNTHCTFAARHRIADGCENRKSWGTYQL